MYRNYRKWNCTGYASPRNSHKRETKSTIKKGYQTKSRAIEEKENFRWITTARIVNKQITAADTTMDCLLICDREGDFFELFAECLSLKLPLLVRLTQNRSLKKCGEGTKNI